MPLRSVKMKRFIFGFQRRVWCPKWTPLSSSCFMVTTAIRRASSAGLAAARPCGPVDGPFLGCRDDRVAAALVPGVAVVRALRCRETEGAATSRPDGRRTREVDPPWRAAQRVYGSSGQDRQISIHSRTLHPQTGHSPSAGSASAAHRCRHATAPSPPAAPPPPVAAPRRPRWPRHRPWWHRLLLPAALTVATATIPAASATAAAAMPLPPGGLPGGATAAPVTQRALRPRGPHRSRWAP